MQVLKRTIQIMFLLIGGALGYIFLPSLYKMMNVSGIPFLDNAFVSVLIGAGLLFILSFMFSDYFVKLLNWLEERLIKLPPADLLFGTIGLILGLLVAFLLSFTIDSIPFPPVQQVLRILLTLTLGYLGFRVFATQREEILQLFSGRAVAKRNKTESNEKSAQQKVLDTSVIIDGRIADIAETGFLEGELVVPQFVLTELQHIADSSDTLKRTRGRRGLDILKRLQDEKNSNVVISEEDFEEVQEVDLKLVRYAKKFNAQVVTNDFNLNKVCDLHQVEVLNINDLANAVKPVVIPGEDMKVVVIKDGKEQNQGIAYLEDGTMIVVEDGHAFIGQAITVTVTSVLQTSAGRMIFAKPSED